ncbi:abortive infection family protein [Flavobacterium sp. P21]|uniref:abortive infection family protein n=1 Tax=Flavobacterium sp. P21 TaxID=3423948 RepID=UPI003D66C765
MHGRQYYKKIRRVLTYKGREDLADLLRHSTSILDESSTFGSRWYSRLSSFEIKSHPQTQEKIDKLPKEDIDEIKRAVMVVFPVKDNEPEITEITFYPDFDIEAHDLVEVKELKRISFEYIHEQIKKCNNKIAEKDFDGAVTSARNLIESICLFILESKTGERHEYDGNMVKLYKVVASILNMSPGDYGDEFLKQILSGVFSIVNGVSGLRNAYSDSHGTAPSKSAYKIDERHAILTVNLAKTISEYLFLSYENSIK